MSGISVVVCANGKGVLEDRLRLARAVARRLHGDISVLAFHSAAAPVPGNREAVGDGGAYDAAREAWTQEDETNRGWKATYNCLFAEPDAQVTARWLDVYEPLSAFATYARACDVVVAGGRSSDPSMSTLDDDVSALALLESGRLALFAAHPTPEQVDPFARVLIAWDDKPAAARAIALALPFIAASASVRLLTVEADAQNTTPCNQILAYFRRHTAQVEVRAIRSGLHSVGHSIVLEAQDWGATLILMGAYEHNRGREMIFGGATRFVIGHAHVAVLMAR